MTDIVNVARRELEINLKWAEKNPTIFAEKLFSFHHETRNFANRETDDSREGFITYIAYDEDRIE